MGLGIKKGDQVMVLSGRDKGKKGKVLEVFSDEGRVLVEGVNIVKKHLKPTPKAQGGIVDRVIPLSLARVMLVCSGCGKPSRIKIKNAQDGTRLRSCRRCGETV